SAHGLREMGRTGLPVGAPLRRAVRTGRSGDRVLANVERGEHRLLARDAGGVHQAARLRDRRSAARTADAPHRRPGLACQGRNEANIGYWQGTAEEFFKLHDYAIDAVRRALPTARVGGPDSAGSGGWWTQSFLEHCLRGRNYATGETGTPLDFVSFHAKGAPKR